MATIIKSNGTKEPLVLERETMLKVLQTSVGGFIELLHTKDGNYLICDEEGKLKNKPVNSAATDLWIHGHADAIVGDVVICDKKEFDDLDKEEDDE
jgi:hypothetical protein